MLIRRAIVVLFAVFAAFIHAVEHATAQTIYSVNTLSDCVINQTTGFCQTSGLLSLRAAILKTVNGDTINFSVSGVIDLTQGALVIRAKNLTIRTSIDLPITLRAATTEALLRVSGAANVTLDGLIFTRFNQQAALENGGAISITASTVNIVNTSFIANAVAATSPAPGQDCSADGTLNFNGGAIFSDDASEIDITGSRFETNSAACDSGGAIFNLGVLDVHQSTFINNATNFTTQPKITVTNMGQVYTQGGAIYSEGPKNPPNNGLATIIERSHFENNRSNQGGAIYMDDRAVRRIVNSTFNMNVAWEGGGAALYNTGSSTILINDTFAYNFVRGGGDGAVVNGITSESENNIVLWQSIIAFTSYTKRVPTAINSTYQGEAFEARSILIGNTTYTFQASNGQASNCVGSRFTYDRNVEWHLRSAPRNTPTCGILDTTVRFDDPNFKRSYTITPNLTISFPAYEPGRNPNYPTKTLALPIWHYRASNPSQPNPASNYATSCVGQSNVGRYVAGVDQIGQLRGPICDVGAYEIPINMVPLPTPTTAPASSVQEAIVYINGTDIFKWTVDTNSSSALNLTNTANCRELYPVPSYDGKRIIYRSNCDADGVQITSGRGTLWMMNADGSNKTFLTDNIYDPNTAWSPDNTKIAFVKYDPMTNKYRLNYMVLGAPIGGAAQPMAVSAPVDMTFTGDSNPPHSILWQNNSSLIFQQQPAGSWYQLRQIAIGQTSSVLISTSDGQNFNAYSMGPQLATGVNNGKLVWSSIYNTEVRINSINSDGTNPRVLMSDSLATVSLQWTPDGTSIMFTRNDSVIFLNGDGGGGFYGPRCNSIPKNAWSFSGEWFICSGTAAGISTQVLYNRTFDKTVPIGGPGMFLGQAHWLLSRPPTTAPVAGAGGDRPIQYGSGTFALRDTLTSGSSTASYTFGATGSNIIPLMGDWNNDGADTAATYNRTTGTFSYTNANGGTATGSFQWGDPNNNFVPLAGDWDGNGTDTFALYNPVNGYWLFRNSLSGGAADVAFPYGDGNQGYKPVVGDWDGDGDDTIGIFNPSNGAWILANALNAAPFASFPYGSGALNPVTGDWDGDGDMTPGMYNPSNGSWLLINENASIAPQVTFTFNSPVNAVQLSGRWGASGGNAPVREFVAPATNTPEATMPPTATAAPQIAPTFAP